MPLNFESDDKTADSKGAGDDKDKTKKRVARHHRVFTKSTYYYATITVKVISAELKAKKSICPFVRLYFGSAAFCTSTKKKTITPEWNEEYSATVDRDDVFQIKIWDNAKLERNLDNYKDVEPLAKKKITLKELCRNGDIEKETRELDLVGGGTLKVELTIIINTPRIGEIHTKQFSYPTWMEDRYKVNQIPSGMEENILAVNTICRYISRWMLNQRAIMASLNNHDDDDDEEQVNESECPDGLSFNLIDIAGCSHDKAIQFTVTYSWSEEKKREATDDDWEAPNILTSKGFHIATKVKKKKVYHYKSLSAIQYQEIFHNVCDGTDTVVQDAQKWLSDNRESYKSLYKFIPLTMPVSHHVVIWYYR